MRNAGFNVVAVVLPMVALLVGCGPRAEIAREQVISKIDSILGDMKVKRREIEHSVAGFKEGIKGLSKAKIKAQVQSDLLQRKSELVAEDVEKIDSTLKTLRGHLTSATPIQVAGRKYGRPELDGMAQRVLRQRKEHVMRLDGFRAAQARLDRVAGTLEGKQSAYEQTLAGITSQLTVIDSNRIALKAMQDVARAMDGAEAGLAASVTELEEKVNDLYAEVEAELRTEDFNWNLAASRQEQQSVEEFVTALGTGRDTVSQIDSLIGASAVVKASE